MADSSSTRRDFFRATFSGAALAPLAAQALAQRPGAGIPTRRLGRTGEQVSILCLGGAHLGRVKEKAEAIRIMHRAIDEGITFFDNAWDYHNGYSEELMGEGLAMDGRRRKVFLMTKNCERDYAGSMKCLDDSLKRLKTDYLDLWQFHEMVYDNDPDWVFEKGGLKAALAARQAGKVRYIGFTGHKDPRIHLKMLAKPHDWDTAQMPVNVMDAFYRSFQGQVVPECLRRDVGVIGMKSLGGGPLEGRIPTETRITAEQCLRFAMSVPVATLCVGVTSMAQLDERIRIARNFEPLGAAEREAILALAAPEAGDGRHELFKSTQRFDGPGHRRQHGFDIDA
jgi:uncharacterized protein